jgi:hypothetical protein
MTSEELTELFKIVDLLKENYPERIQELDKFLNHVNLIIKDVNMINALEDLEEILYNQRNLNFKSQSI